MRAAPAVSCARCTKKSAHEHTGSAEAVRHSLRNGFTAYAVLSPATNSSCHRRRRIKADRARLGRLRLRQLDTSNGCQDHTVLPYATASFVLRAVDRSRVNPPCEHLARRRCRVHRIPSHVRDDRQRPSWRDGTARAGRTDLPDGKAKYFCAKGWTGFCRLICPSGRFVARAYAKIVIASQRVARMRAR